VYHTFVSQLPSVLLRYDPDLGEQFDGIIQTHPVHKGRSKKKTGSQFPQYGRKPDTLKDLREDTRADQYQQ